jgi:uncharacterized membrane protein YphA (DoxX/SURF4 family)
MKTIRLICRIITALVFMFSGFIKAIDPHGFAYKLHDYFQAFHIDFLQFLSLPLSMLICLAEFLGGFAILTGLKQKSGIWIVFLLTMFFTPLTLVLAIFNPVSDCGCFGDAIKLTNWQTFGKNIILLIFVLVLFSERKKTVTIFKSVTEWTITGFVALLFILFSAFNLRYLPVIDFLPYRAGTNIESKMKIPEGSASDQYSVSFIYEKNGVRKEFTINDYPASDTSWKFIDQKSVLIKKGYEPPIHDFSIVDLNNENITGKVLSDKGYSLLMISKKLADVNHNKLKKGFDLGAYCINNGISFYILTASGKSEAINFGSNLPFCFTDETALKTMIRSDPGYILLRNGTIIGKWSSANVPEKEWFSNFLTGKEVELPGNQELAYLVITSAVTIAAFFLLFFILRGKRSSNTNT